MSACASHPSDLTDRQLAMLERLAEIGMEIAEAAGRQARGEGEGGVDPALSFSRAARAVRLTIALQARLVAEQTAFGREQATARATEASRRRDRIHARIEQAAGRRAEAEGAEAEAIEDLASAAWERLTETDDAELLDRPVEELVALICAELGLPAGWAEGPLSPTAGDSSPGNGGAGKGAAAVRLPCGAGEVAAAGGRRGRSSSRPPPRRLSG